MTNKNKGGRPKIELDETNWNEVEKLCGLQCTGEEIADFVGISYDTLVRRIQDKFDMSFADYFKKHSSKGKRSLRRKQYEQAMNGNTTLLIWLGKQYLGQSDKQEVDNKSSDGSMSPAPVEIKRTIVDVKNGTTEEYE